MKRSLFLALTAFLLFASCTTTQLIDNWKNPDIDRYEPQKVLIVGLTSNIEARKKYENQLKAEFELRGAEAVVSLSLFDPSFRTEKMTEEELKTLENKLIEDGFDTVLLTKIIGVEDKIAFKEKYQGYNETHQTFTDDYLMHQDIFYNPEYYDEYTIYHSETSMYCICPTKDRELIWKGYIDIVDPKSINESVDDYIKLTIAVLEEQQLINQKSIINKEEKEDLID
ncbi:hypothetical protein IMCC3317_10000 [Kordia antarctica]|uniref:Cardiolipin synthetase n=1 Tax=Kordia antarctica TaxID=1218801 RepID=A0A7L4ZI98_9FLAO|nr:hypothetical protein [Kordia antarctica]QHI35654.1 hypothetical protein IMCC3317_10000 [Kordia antarctica]